jgi:tetratricopeptide (TPR) repeat protein/serine/threonine protein kinase
MTDEKTFDPPSADDENSSARLEQIVVHYLDQLNSGQSLDPKQILAENPLLGQEILESLQEFVNLGSVTESEPELGTLGDYGLISEISRGGMGVVYEAWDGSMDRRVALKVLPQGVPSDAKAFTRFVREAKVAGKLNHANIVSVFGMGIQADAPYYAMEYVRGETLSQILKRLKNTREKAEEGTKSSILTISRLLGSKPPAKERSREASGETTDTGSNESGSTILDTDEVHRDYCINVSVAFSGVADGLQHAHENKIIHRDIKPSNLILEKDGRLRILDFGLARMEGQESLTRSGSFLGTPLYMSPEQARARKVTIDHRTDIYSLGATLYEMLTWRPPFKGKNQQDTLSQIISKDPQPPRKMNPRIARDLETIVLKCLRKDPQDRFSTAEALAQDLRRFVRGDPIEARPEPVLNKYARLLVRFKWQAAALCAVILLGITSGLLFHKQRQEAYTEKEKLYRDIVIDAVAKMELGRPVRHYIHPIDSSRGLKGPVNKEDLKMATVGVTSQLEMTLPDPVEEAVSDLEEAVALFPIKPDALFHLAWGRLKLGKIQDARKTLTEIIKNEPGFVPAFDLMVAIHENSGDTSAAQAMRNRAADFRRDVWSNAWVRAYKYKEDKEWAKANQAFGELIALEEAGGEYYLGFSISTRLGRGGMRLMAKDFSGAVEDFSAACALWPGRIAPALLLGKTYYLKGDPGHANKIFEELYSRKPDLDEVCLRVAELYLRLDEYLMGLEWAEKARESARREAFRSAFLQLLGRQEEAIEAGYRAIEIDPSIDWAYFYLGNALYALGKYEEAVAAYRRGIEIEPNDRSLHTNLGAALVDQGKPEEAIVECQKAIELNSDNSGAHINLGNALAALGKVEEAIAEYRKALELDPDNFRAHGNLGNTLYKQGKYEEAVAEYRRGIAIEPHEISLHNNLGATLKAQGILEEAIAEFRKAIELDPDIPEAHYNLGVGLEAQGKTEEAIAEYRKAIELNPDNPEAHSNLGNALSALGNAGEAIAECRKSIELDPDNSEAHKCLGRALFSSGKAEEAMDEYRKAIELDPDNSEAHNWFGRALFASGKSEEAMDELRKAIEIDPEIASAHFDLGFFLNELGKYEEAINEYRKAIKIDPDDARMYVNLGSSLNSLGNYEEAIEELRKAIEFDPNESAAYANLGNALTALGKPKEAIAEFRKAIEIDPEIAIAHCSLGTALSDLGNYEESMSEFRKAIELDPEFAGAYYNLGYSLLYKMGKPDEAIAEFRKAIELDPEFAKARCNLGIALFILGKHEEAIAEYRRVIELDPNNKNAHYGLGLAHIKQGELDEAISNLRSIIELSPKFTNAYILLGKALKDKGDLDGAVKAWQKAVELDPDNSKVRRNLDLILVEQGNGLETIIEYWQDKEQDNATAFINLGTVFQKQGNYKEAIAAYRKAIELNPMDASAYYNLGSVFLIEGKNEEEVAVLCRKVIELDPSHVGAHVNLGIVLGYLGKLEEAIVYYRKALKLDPDNKTAKLNLELALEKHGKVIEVKDY